MQLFIRKCIKCGKCFGCVINNTKCICDDCGFNKCLAMEMDEEFDFTGGYCDDCREKRILANLKTVGT